MLEVNGRSNEPLRGRCEEVEPHGKPKPSTRHLQNLTYFPGSADKKTKAQGTRDPGLRKHLGGFRLFCIILGLGLEVEGSWVRDSSLSIRI